jgi:hypothetical protein
VKLLNPYFDLYEVLKGEPVELQLAIRKKLIWAYSWAIPNEEAIAALKELSPLIELGAGTGYWAWLLRQAGADVVAFDLNPYAPPHWTRVEAGDEGTVQEHTKRTLFLCWPSYQEPMAYQALERYAGQHFAYIGEMNGRTADEAFHRILQERFQLKREVVIPVWPGYKDRLYLFERA